MKSRSKKIAEHSINSALSAIEIYNKPDFKDREQIFCVLLTVAWESLLKARLVQQNGNRLTCLYVKETPKRYKRNRNGLPFTIDVYEALRRCGVDAIVGANIARVVEIRDTVVHLTADSPTLPYLVFTLGTASLQNYAKLIKEWFGIKLSEYHFYILPLAFAAPFKTLKMADLAKEPAEIRTLISAVAKDQETLAAGGDFDFTCEIQTTLVSAKKITTETDLVATVDPRNPDAVIVERKVSTLDQYPLSASELWKAVKKELSTAKQNDIWKAIADLGIKDNLKYSKYSYRTKQDAAVGPRKGTTSIYNHDAIKIIVDHLGANRARN